MGNEARMSELERWKDAVDGELYEDLLNRYERVLMFAGQLRERLNHQKLLVERNGDLERENQRLHRLAAAGDSYIRVLERALSSAGVIRDDPEV